MLGITNFRYFELLLFAVITFVFVDNFLFSDQIFGFSPKFGLQEITNKNNITSLRWFDMKTHEPSNKGDPSAYIIAANYFSDGQILNATLWLLQPFNEKPTSTQISYGMLIDADDNNNTGVSGIDYNFQIISNNEAHTWSKVLEKWSPVPIGGFSTMVLTNQSKQTGFFEKGKGFVSLSLNLSSILYPQKYKVLFYAEAKDKKSDLVDFTNWVHIPPPQIKISTNPRALDLYRGQGQKDVEVIVDSTTGVETAVRLSTSQSGVEDIIPNLYTRILPIASYGTGTTSLKINASQYASIKPYTLFIFANSTFPKQIIKNPKFINPEEAWISLVANNSSDEPILNHTSLVLNVHEPPSILDQINDFWSKIGSPISFLYGIIAGISPWIYKSIRNYSKKTATSNK